MMQLRDQLQNTCGRAIAVLSGNVLIEEVGRLDDVIVDAHQDHVVHLHAKGLPTARLARSKGDIAIFSPRNLHFNG